ncbi:uncharacterized protein LOC143574662 [Bidens hawaiensis]|uniref:uncharacterized protein LOC143574662 n=1 Tax=Bidens hawaiensis TaxID=980011 RepID=UPI004049E418
MTDPSDHLLNFKAVSGVSGWTLPYWCHMFALTLTGAAREWFEKLPDGQIKSWDDLVAKFSQHFSQQHKHTRDPSEILSAVRRDNESLESFITRFNNEILNIGGNSEDMLRGAFRVNVKSLEMVRCLTGRDAGKSDRQHWTPLKKTPSEILTTENIEFRKPQPLIKRVNLNPNKHCMFNEDIGHDTNECISLKNEMESAIKSGKLDHLLNNVRQGPQKNTTPADKGLPRKQIKDLNVHMIQGDLLRSLNGRRQMKMSGKVNP